MASTFQRAPRRAPNNIGRLLVQIEDAGAAPTARYEIEVRYSDGLTELTKGDLLPYLTAAQQAALQALLAAVRAKAVAELL